MRHSLIQICDLKFETIDLIASVVFQVMNYLPNVQVRLPSGPLPDGRRAKRFHGRVRQKASPIAFSELSVICRDKTSRPVWERNILGAASARHISQANVIMFGDFF
jgi:hypothetical protein